MKNMDQQKDTTTTTTAAASNPHMLPTLQQRKNFLLKMSYMPVAVCFISFGKAAVNRILSFHNNKCQKFGWYSSANGDVICDHKLMDFHAITALMWLAIFVIQVLVLIWKKPKWHKYFGRLGMVGAFVTVGGMFWIAIQDMFHPIEDTDRPPHFTKFMVIVAATMMIFLIMSTYALMKKKRDIDQHMIWIFRSFVTSFSTPMVRLYPLLLRVALGQSCLDMNRHRIAIESVFVSKLTIVLVYVIAQRYTQPKFWDMYMKFQFVTMMLSIFENFRYASEHGSFLSGMVQCALQQQQQHSDDMIVDGDSNSTNILPMVMMDTGRLMMSFLPQHTN